MRKLHNMLCYDSLSTQRITQFMIHAVTILTNFRWDEIHAASITVTSDQFVLENNGLRIARMLSDSFFVTGKNKIEREIYREEIYEILDDYTEKELSLDTDFYNTLDNILVGTSYYLAITNKSVCLVRRNNRTAVIHIPTYQFSYENFMKTIESLGWLKAVLEDVTPTLTKTIRLQKMTRLGF